MARTADAAPSLNMHGHLRWRCLYTMSLLTSWTKTPTPALNLFVLSVPLLLCLDKQGNPRYVRYNRLLGSGHNATSWERYKIRQGFIRRAGSGRAAAAPPRIISFEEESKREGPTPAPPVRHTERFRRGAQGHSHNTELQNIIWGGPHWFALAPTLIFSLQF